MSQSAQDNPLYYMSETALFLKSTKLLKRSQTERYLRLDK